MRNFSTYTRAQFKRSVRYLPFVFLITLIICTCLSLILTSSVNTDDDVGIEKKIRIGITGDFEDTFLGFGLSAIQSFDSSRFALELVECDVKTAEESLKRGDMVGYIAIPDNFINDAVSGEVGKLQFVTNQSNAEIANIFKEEVLELVSCIIVESQKGVYGMQELFYQLGANGSEIDDETMILAAEYISLILARSNALDVKLINVPDVLSFSGYMFSGLTVLFMLLAGIVTCPLFVRRDLSLYRLLRSRRNGATSQIASEYLSFFAIMLINNSVLLFALMMGSGKISGTIPELSALSTAEMLLIILKFIPAIALITSMQFLMYQLADSIVSGILMQFIGAVLIAYVSGCFYPISFFPKAMRVIGGIVPPGVAREYLSSLLMDDTKASLILFISLYFIAFSLLSVAVRYRKIKRA